MGNILDYMKLSLDANLLPKTHAAGGAADIVYEYPKSGEWPEHHLLIEATLANNTNQRHMESEPVTRHLGNDILESGNTDSYCVFVSPTLNPNVISDFRLRQNMVWYDVNDTSHKVNGLKIIPLTTEDIRRILTNLSRYKSLYNKFDAAFNDTAYPDPIEWYRNCVAS